MNILIVGASSDLGAALYSRAHKRGHLAVGTYNANSRVDGFLQMDVRDSRSVESGVAAALEQMQFLDAVVFCSAVDHPGLIVQANIEKWHEVMEVNYFGALRVTKSVLPHFLHRRAGVFEFISSGLATRSNVGATAYASSKAALNALSLGISKEYGKAGIRSFTVMPGFFDGGLIRNLDASRKARAATLIDLKRLGGTEEIAEFCLAALENSSYLSASNLEIHGGLA